MTPLTLNFAATPSGDWADFVAEDPGATLYHTLPWIQVAHESFGCECYFLEVRSSDGKLQGVLPLVRQRSRLFGDRLTSLPYCNYGGALARDPAIALALMQKAVELATSLGVASVELRDRVPRAGWEARTDKAGYGLALPGSLDELAIGLGSKLRAQVKRAEREPIAVRAGGAELIPAFYSVFAENMRDLGTPVYPRRFFETIARLMPSDFQVVVVDLDGRPAAAGFLLFFRGTAEAPWAASTRPAKSRAVNMRLYWEMLNASIARGATHFDFGRSTVDSGTARFKEQWGALARPLYWHRWPGAGPDHGERDEGATGLASRAWQRLPLWAANRLGPWISPALPW